MAKNYRFFICLLLTAFINGAALSGDIRLKVKQVYSSQIGVREKTGHNDGKQVETYLHYCGLTKGQPWCASFVCWCLGQAQVSNPRDGGCPYLLERGQLIYKRGKNVADRPPQASDVFFIWFPDKGRVAHTGYIDSWSNTWCITVEGNTNDAGSREGDGVYRKRRLKRQIYAVANYIH